MTPSFLSEDDFHLCVCLEGVSTVCPPPVSKQEKTPPCQKTVNHPSSPFSSSSLALSFLCTVTSRIWTQFFHFMFNNEVASKWVEDKAVLLNFAHNSLMLPLSFKDWKQASGSVLTIIFMWLLQYEEQDCEAERKKSKKNFSSASCGITRSRKVIGGSGTRYPNMEPSGRSLWSVHEKMPKEKVVLMWLLQLW